MAVIRGINLENLSECSEDSEGTLLKNIERNTEKLDDLEEKSTKVKRDILKATIKLNEITE